MCAAGCFAEQLGNGVCEEVCNTAECLFDGGDCECHAGCSLSGLASCSPECLNYACGFSSFGFAGGCKDSFAFSLAADVQASSRDLFATFSTITCAAADPYGCPLLFLELDFSYKSCYFYADDHGYITPCFVKECAYTFGYCNNNVHPSCQLGFGSSRTQCLKCTKMRVLSTCVDQCPRRYRPDFTIRDLCVPRVANSTADSPDEMYVYQSSQDREGTLQRPFGKLVLALAAAWQDSTVVYLLGKSVSLEVDLDSKNPELAELKSYLDPLGVTKAKAIRVQSLPCSAQRTIYCWSGITEIDVVQNVQITVTYRVEFVQVRITSRSLFSSSAFQYCPYPQQSPACQLFNTTSLFLVKPSGELLLQVTSTQDVAIHNLTLQLRSVVEIQQGAVELRNVSFLNVHTRSSDSTGGVIASFQTCESELCGSLTFAGGEVSALNLGQTYSAGLRLAPFLYIQSLGSIDLANVSFAHNFAVAAYSNPAILEPSGILYVENVYKMKVAGCEFSSNFVTGGLIIINSKVILPLSFRVLEEPLVVIEDCRFTDNFGEMSLITMLFYSDLQSIRIAQVAFQRNSIEGQSLLHIENKATLSDTDLQGSAGIPARFLSISSLTATDHFSLSSVLSVTNCVNVDLARIDLSHNGEFDSEVIATHLQSLGYGREKERALPVRCSALVWVDRSTEVGVREVTISGSLCAAGTCGVAVTSNPGQTFISHYTSEHNLCQSASGLALTLSAATSVAIDSMAVTNCTNSIGQMASFAGGVVSIAHSVFRENVGVMGVCMNFVGVNEVGVCNTTFLRNRADGDVGGAAYWQLANRHTVRVKITSSAFRENSAVSGGALYLDSRNSTTVWLTVESCEFSQNSAAMFAAGLYVGLFVAFDPQSTLSSSVFTAHRSVYASIYLTNSGGTLTITDCEFHHNAGTIASVLEVETQAAALTVILDSWFHDNTDGPTILKSNSPINSVFHTRNCRFTGNPRSDVQMAGGTWRDSDSSFQDSIESKVELSAKATVALLRTQFTLTHSDDNGGAIHLMHGSSLDCEYCSFLNNSAGHGGGAICIEQNSTAFVSYSTFRYNTAATGGAAVLLTSTPFTTSRLQSCVFEYNDGGSYGVISAQSASLLLTNSTLRRNRGLECAGLMLLMATAVIAESEFAEMEGTTAAFALALTSSVLTVTGSRFVEGRCGDGGLIYLLSTSRLAMVRCTFRGMKAARGGVVSAYSSSAIELEGVLVDSVHSSAAGSLLLLSESSLLVTNSHFRQFGYGGIAGSQLSNVTIINSEFAGGEGQNGASLYFEQCSLVLIRGCSFTNLKADSGGAGYFDGQSQLGSVTIDDCRFLSNSAEVGGALYIIRHSLRLANSVFAFNTAAKGGAVALSQCTATLSESQFRENTATTQGGAVSWDSQQPTLSALKFASNFAPYGSDIASFPYALQVDALRPASGGRLLGSGSYVVTAAPGQVLDTAIVVSLRDHYGAVIATDNSSVGVIECSGGECAVSGNSKVLANSGVLQFDGIWVYARPNSTVEVQVSTTTIPHSYSGSVLRLTFEMRACRPGEYETAESCSVCSPGTYSFSPTTPCQTCPANALCLGNFTVLPTKGYWRSGVYSPVVRECPNLDSCLGGLMDPRPHSPTGYCATGYKGNLCQSCESGFSVSTRNRCGRCPALSLNVVRLFFIGVGALVLIVIMVWSTLRSASRPAATHSTLIRIFLNNLQVVLLVTDFRLQWPGPVLRLLEAQEAAGTLSEQAYSVDCLLDQTNPVWATVYQKCLFVALLPIPLIACTVLYWTIAALRRRKWALLKHECAATVVILFFLVLPNLVKSLFSLLSCTEIEPGAYWLTVDLDIRCWSAVHSTFLLTVGLPGIVVWVLGVPLLCLLLLARQKHNHHEVWLKQQFGFLISGYRRNTYYWEFVILYRKVLIIICAVFLSGSVLIQALTVHFLLLAAFFWHFTTRPYNSPLLNSVEFWSIIVCDVTISCGLYYLSNSISEGTSWLLLVIIAVSNTVFVAYWLAALLKHFRYVLSRRYPQVRRLLAVQDETDEVLEECLDMRKPVETELAGARLIDCYREMLKGGLSFHRFKTAKYRFYPTRHSSLSMSSQMIADGLI